jgi:predicted anti-sigma-YlaC factor YlaD
MDCDFIRKNLVDIVERKLPAETQEEIDAHTRSCNGCAGLVERFAQFWQALEQPSRIEPSPDFWIRLQRRIHEPGGKEAQAIPLLLGRAAWLRPAAAVAILVLGILVGNYLGNFLAWGGLNSFGQQQSSTQTEQLFDYYLGGLDDFPTGSVGEFYVNPGNNT